MEAERIELNRKELKREAKESMARRRPSTYLVALVYLLIVLVLQFLSLRIRYPGLGTRELVQLYGGAGLDQETLLRLLYSSPGTIGTLLYYAIEIMSLIVGVGFISFCLLASRRSEAGFGSLFDGFGIFFRALWLSVLRALLLMLWALPAAFGIAILAVVVQGPIIIEGAEAFVAQGLDTPLALLALALIIAGIVLELIAYYRYAMCFFILLDAPDKSAFQCLRESREMTRGYKGKLFVLDLSFLGWMLLSAIPFVILYTLPYMQVTQANYYRTLSGRWEAPRNIDVTI